VIYSANLKGNSLKYFFDGKVEIILQYFNFILEKEKDQRKLFKKK